MPTFKMASPSAPSAISLRARASIFSMHALTGRRQYTVLEDGTSRLELFSSNRVGCNMKHVHTFGCPVFPLQNALASGKSLPRWSPHACLGLNLGPSPMYTMNVYLVLNLITGCVSPQYHCCFNNVFETTCHGGPDVSGTISWQKIMGLEHASTILFEMSAPIQCSIMYPETPSEGDVPREQLPISPPVFDVTSDDYSISVLSVLAASDILLTF